MSHHNNRQADVLKWIWQRMFWFILVLFAVLLVLKRRWKKWSYSSKIKKLVTFYVRLSFQRQRSVSIYLFYWWHQSIHKGLIVLRKKWSAFKDVIGINYLGIGQIIFFRKFSTLCTCYTLYHRRNVRYISNALML